MTNLRILWATMRGEWSYLLKIIVVIPCFASYRHISFPIEHTSY